jgi:hypothetical protein
MKPVIAVVEFEEGIVIGVLKKIGFFNNQPT